MRSKGDSVSPARDPANGLTLKVIIVKVWFKNPPSMLEPTRRVFPTTQLAYFWFFLHLATIYVDGHQPRYSAVAAIEDTSALFPWLEMTERAATNRWAYTYVIHLEC